MDGADQPPQAVDGPAAGLAAVPLEVDQEREEHRGGHQREADQVELALLELRHAGPGHRRGTAGSWLGLAGGHVAATPSTLPNASFRGISAAMAAVGPLLLVALLVLATLAVRRARADRAFRRAAAPAEAEITDIRWKTVGPLPERDRLAYPLLRFALPDGSVYETRSEVGGASRLEVGDRVGVLYLPDDPSRVRVDSQASPSTGSTSGT